MKLESHVLALSPTLIMVQGRHMQSKLHLPYFEAPYLIIYTSCQDHTIVATSSRKHTTIPVAIMSETAFAKAFMSSMDRKPVRMSSDYVADPRKYPAQSPVCYSIFQSKTYFPPVLLCVTPEFSLIPFRGCHTYHIYTSPHHSHPDINLRPSSPSPLTRIRVVNDQMSPPNHVPLQSL